MMTSSERVCIRGCTVRGVHLDSCPDRDVAIASASCRGCQPASAAAGALICTTCFGRFRRVLSDAPDLLGRVRSLSGQAKAQVYGPVKSSGSVQSPEQIRSDELDALTELSANLGEWATMLEPAAWHPVLRSSWSAERVAAVTVDDVAVILRGLDAIANRRADVLGLAEAVLVVHTPDPESGARAWSLQDAMNRWGVERRDRHVHPGVDEDEGSVLEREPVREWHDPLLDLRQAAKRVERSQRTLRRWIQQGKLAVAMRVRQADSTYIQAVYASEVDRVAEREKLGRPKQTASATPKRDSVSIM